MADSKDTVSMMEAASASAAEIKSLNSKVNEMSMQNRILYYENEYYFDKLHNIEIFCEH